MVKIPYKAVVPEVLGDINLLDVKLQNCPYHAYQMLRDEAPVWVDPAELATDSKAYAIGNPAEI